MPRPRSTPLIVAALATLLAGCASGLRSPALTERAGASIGRQIAIVCPTPTDVERMKQIATYLETTLPGPGLDALATEWERLDAAARTCRAGR